MSEPPWDGRMRVPSNEDDGDLDLELDVKRDSGSWRGAMPARIGDGPNAKTIDPEASQIDPEVFRSVRTAALAPIPDRPAEIVTAAAVVRGRQTAGSGAWETGELAPALDTIPPNAKEGFRDSSANLPRASASRSVGGVRPMRNSSANIRPISLSGEVVKAPYELAQDKKNVQMKLVAGVAVAVLVVGAVLLKVVGVF